MNAPASITAPLDAATLAMVEELARARGISGEEFAAQAIRQAAEHDAEEQVALQIGIDAADRGDLIAHGKVMAELDAMIATHEARCAS